MQARWVSKLSMRCPVSGNNSRCCRFVPQVRTRDRIFASVPELIHYHIEHGLPIVSSGSSLTLGTAVVIDMSQE